jgi:YegS/Rv2252/BmrU family lipid kinase
VLFVVLAQLVQVEWRPLVRLDRAVSKPLADLTEGMHTLRDIMRVIEAATGTIASTILTLVIVALLLLKSHRRLAAYAALVITTSMLTSFTLKPFYDRHRPDWQNPIGGLDNGSLPSGHAVYAGALAGVLVVVATMLVRRAGMRRLFIGLLAAYVVLVCLDRMLLGRHYLTDVVAGLLVAGFWVFLWLAFYSPLPRGHAFSAAPLVESVPGTKRDLAVILNPAKVEDQGQFEAIVTAMAVESGWSKPTWLYTTTDDSGGGQAHQASVDGADLVLVCGGDGTVREVCAELAGTGIPVGIVPAGTGNLLGRNLDLPLYFRSAIDVALNGQDRAIDMVKVSGDGLEETSFLVMAGMGFDAAIMEGVNEDIKNKVGWLAYVLSALKALMFPTMRLEVSVDDGPVTKHRARTVVVGNVGSLQGGMVLLPDASIDDGQLDVVLLYPRRFLSWIPLFVRVLSRREEKAGESVARFTGKKVVIRASADVPRQIDGDSIGQGRELTCENLHGRLLVRVPR